MLNLWQPQTYGEWRKSKIYKMWALLLIIMPGKRDYVIWCQIEVCEMIRVIFGFIRVLYMFVFQIDWLGKRRKGNMWQGCYQAFLVVVI